ncbi:hypothetical protein HanIR_Chr06g0264201 [Helianthus annuus]|nr:hypothetical protein HanIR_Chr06g0264201 [Helianthus annuus]KAJ0736984.1 hypothetical protein HanLR1_Chr06g0201901 [Helianthus annuus]
MVVVNLICLEGVKRLGETVPFLLLFLSHCIVESRHSCCRTSRDDLDRLSVLNLCIKCDLVLFVLFIC